MQSDKRCTPDARPRLRKRIGLKQQPREADRIKDTPKANDQIAKNADDEQNLIGTKAACRQGLRVGQRLRFTYAMPRRSECQQIGKEVGLRRLRQVGAV